MAQDAQQ
jgi:hypothetical protein